MAAFNPLFEDPSASPSLLAQWHHRPCVESTSRWAWSFWESADSLPAVPGVLFLADEQTAGRGTAGRRWESPPGNLYVSLLLPKLAYHCGWLTGLALLAGVSAWQTVSAHYPAVAVRLQGINDLYVDEAKLAGVLTQTRIAANRQTLAVVLGWGLNLVSTPTVSAYSTTCLANHTPDVTASLEHRVQLAQTFQQNVNRWLSTAHQPGDTLTVEQRLAQLYATAAKARLIVCNKL